MPLKEKTCKQLGIYKTVILNALFNNKEIMNMLLGDTSGKTAGQIRTEFKNHVKTHLFVDDTIEETWSYIFFDVYIPYIHNRIKKPAIKLIAISHRDTLDTYESPLDEDGNPVYPGNRSNALMQMIEECLVNNEDVARKIGIGPLDISGVSLYNGNHYYGYILDFEVKEFR